MSDKYGNPQSYSETDAPRQSFVSSVETAATYSDETAKRAEVLANRLCGMAPTTNDANSKLTSVPGSVFENISSMGSGVNRNLDRIASALSRIEASLP
jgi:flagellar hook-associated protein FlgK